MALEPKCHTLTPQPTFIYPPPSTWTWTLKLFKMKTIKTDFPAYCAFPADHQFPAVFSPFAFYAVLGIFSPFPFPQPSGFFFVPSGLYFLHFLKICAGGSNSNSLYKGRDQGEEVMSMWISSPLQTPQGQSAAAIAGRGRGQPNTLESRQQKQPGSHPTPAPFPHPDRPLCKTARALYTRASHKGNSWLRV